MSVWRSSKYSTSTRLLIVLLWAYVCVVLSQSQSQEGECGWEDEGACSACGLVIAPSTISNAGLGIFTLKELLPDDLIGHGDMVIPMPSFLTVERTWDDYTWVGRVYQGELDAFVPGLQSLTNSHLALVNIHPHKPAAKVFQDTVDSTPYHHLTTEATTQIPANSELFTVYGDHWFEGRERYQHLSTSQDYALAQTLAQKFDILDNHLAQDWPMELWEVVGDLLATWKRKPSLLNILPQYHDVQQVLQLGIRSLYQSQATKDREELLSPAARCVDGLRPAPSQIHHLGAFATRGYPEGTIITGSPLLQSLQHHWNAKAQIWDSFTKSYKSVNQTSGADDDYALMINYCWSHEQSSIVLCPYGIGISYINHSRKPNVKIQWAPHGQLSQNDAYFQKTPIGLSKSPKGGLSLDYVALRDIQEGEELTVDYGRAWKQALRDFRHTRRNTKESNVEEYNTHQTVFLKTEAEQLVSPYPTDLELKCHPNIMKSTLPLVEDDMWKQIVERELLECHVLERQHLPVSDGSSQILYAVRVWYDGTWRGRGGIPRAYMKWVRKHQPSVFRFPMQLPDAMVPEAWRDS
jgi:hypothetical protein